MAQYDRSGRVGTCLRRSSSISTGALARGGLSATERTMRAAIQAETVASPALMFQPQMPVTA